MEEHDFAHAEPEARNKEKLELLLAENVKPPERIPNRTIKKLWGDPVISKLISAIIISLSTFFLTFLLQLVKEWKFIDSVRNVLLYPLPTWMYLLVILVVFAIFFLYKFIMRKYFNKTTRGFPFDEPIGNFKFGELFNSLLDMPPIQDRQYFPGVHQGPQNLLEAFLSYLPMYNTEVSIDHRDSSLLYFRIGPQLVSFGLLEYVVSKDLGAQKNQWVIRPTKEAYKFYAYCEKYRLYVDSIVKNKATKAEKPKTENKNPKT